MRREKIKINLGFKKIEIRDVEKLSEFGKIIGLMFKRNEKTNALLFEFNKPTKMKIHSLFVFFKFAAIWLDDKNNIIDMKIVKPFRLFISCRKPFYKLIEIPLNKKYEKNIKTLFDKKEFLLENYPPRRKI